MPRWDSIADGPMKLSAELFADFTASMNASGEQPPFGERRRVPRVEVCATVWLEVVSDDGGGDANAARQTVIAEVRDFSPRGAKLVFRAALAPGRQFIMRLKRGDGGLIAILCT